MCIHAIKVQRLGLKKRKKKKEKKRKEKPRWFIQIEFKKGNISKKYILKH